MSAPYIAWAFQQRDLTAPQRLVLIDLCDRANGDRVCFPSFPKIAHDCELSIRAAYAAVRHLCDVRGLIAKVTDKQERADILAKAGARKGTLSNVYRILRPADDEPQTSHAKSNGKVHTPARNARVSREENSPTPAHDAGTQLHTPERDARVNSATPAPRAGQPLHHVQKTPAPNAPEPSKESSTEPETRAGARESVGFNSFDLKGSKQGAVSPPVREREPTPAEIEASRKAAADAIAALPPRMAAVFQSLGGALHGVAYAPGRSAQLDRHEQIEALRPGPKPAYLSREQLRAAELQRRVMA